jgi:hypothetical protein
MVEQKRCIRYLLKDLERLWKYFSWYFHGLKEYSKKKNYKDNRKRQRKVLDKVPLLLIISEITKFIQEKEQKRKDTNKRIFIDLLTNFIQHCNISLILQNWKISIFFETKNNC